MKNLFNKFAILMLVSVLTFNFTSCKKEDLTSDEDLLTEQVVPLTAQDYTIELSFNRDTTFLISSNNEITITEISNLPQNGIVTSEGNKITYTPEVDYVGTESFNYTIKNASGATSTGTITIIVSDEVNTNKAPTLTISSINLSSAINYFDISEYFSDEDGDIVTLVLFSAELAGNANGEVRIEGKTDIVYEPTSPIWFGTEKLQVKITDGTNEVTVEITLNYGSNAQIETYNLIAPYLDKTFEGGDVASLTLKSDGTLTSNRKLAFYFDSNAQFASFVILDNGNFKMNTDDNGVLFREFTITALDDSNNDGTDYYGLIFTNSDQPFGLKVWNEIL